VCVCIKAHCQGRGRPLPTPARALALSLQLEDLGEAVEDDQEMLDTPCSVCERADDWGKFLLCDGPGCERGAHTHCVGLKSVPSSSSSWGDCLTLVGGWT